MAETEEMTEDMHRAKRKELANDIQMEPSTIVLYLLLTVNTYPPLNTLQAFKLLCQRAA